MTNIFGEYIKSLRKDKSIRQAAKDIGVSHTYLDSLEKGYDPRTDKVRSPSIMMIYKIAKYYSVSEYDLFDMIIADEEDEECTHQQKSDK
ncbi:helix-turn-helix transcriptional regulator [Mammaliicoccus sciuri]|uniref:helix-turn-helix transcriptional regulator n=1 Tax=Mammaliicoccus sciuri TaxID=1296 RepID=UPI001FB1BD36|nr:helix-turn-helix transcriptional regulator [Mammaliicoccus sciuri]MCJ1765836.1 helix-turn-helix domain-containing protein [Mammaliicoccus sciuri]